MKKPPYKKKILCPLEVAHISVINFLRVRGLIKRELRDSTVSYLQPYNHVILYLFHHTQSVAYRERKGPQRSGMGEGRAVHSDCHMHCHI